MNKKKFNSINVVPLVDIMLVIIVILLSAATFNSTSKLSVDLPKSSFGVSTNQDALNIYIDQSNRITINHKAISLSSLESKLEYIDSNKTIQIHCDNFAQYGSFASVLILLSTKGLSNISIVTQNE